MSPVSDLCIESTKGTVTMGYCKALVNSSASQTIKISGGTLNVNTRTSVTSPVNAPAISATGDSVINIKGGTVSNNSSANQLADCGVIEHDGSGTVNLSSGTVNNTKFSDAIIIRGTAKFVMTGGYINVSSKHAILTRSYVEPSVEIRGGTITQTSTEDYATIWTEATGKDNRNYIYIYGGTITSNKSCIVGVSDGGTGAATIRIGNPSSTTYTQNSPKIGSHSKYVIMGYNNNTYTHFYNGCMISPTSDYASNCKNYIGAISGYKKTTTKGYEWGANYYLHYFEKK